MNDFFKYDQLHGKFIPSTRTASDVLELPKKATLDFEPNSHPDGFGILGHVLINPPMILYTNDRNLVVEEFPFGGQNIIFQDGHTQTENLKSLVEDRLRKGSKATIRLRKKLGISLIDYLRLRILKK